ncbi:MAG: hypothetical protein K0U66_05500 [Gammaproteobacteria bacterium]|nr:hypothetical protein [Pseudomonadota bacterium]MCH9663096.1 hypothetical protein [Gammaproteobacteria bacterium]
MILLKGLGAADFTFGWRGGIDGEGRVCAVWTGGDWLNNPSRCGGFIAPMVLL